jgi:hypothetical protein
VLHFWGKILDLLVAWLLYLFIFEKGVLKTIKYEIKG